jgi:glyoxylase-like metal-dependent hydrolase (beta-lactamase superfamily II)
VKYTTVLAMIGLFSFSSFSQDITVKQLKPNLYQHVSYQEVEGYGNVPANGLVYIEGENAYIIDSPWSNEDSEKLVNWAEQKGKKVKAVIATHFHHDASGGLALFNDKNIPTYASQMTNNLLKEKGRVSAKHEIGENHFSFEHFQAEVFYPGKGHSPDNIVVWLPKVSTLFGGCFVKSTKSKSLGNLGDASVVHWPESIDSVLKKYPDIKHVIPGHGAIGTIEMLQHTKKLAVEKSTKVKEAI